MEQSGPHDDEAPGSGSRRARRLLVRDRGLGRTIATEHGGTVRPPAQQMVPGQSHVHEEKALGMRRFQQPNLRSRRPGRLHGTLERRAVQPAH